MNKKGKTTPTENIVYRIQKMRNAKSILEWKGRAIEIISMFEGSYPDNQQDEILLHHGQEILRICNKKLEKIKSNV